MSRASARRACPCSTSGRALRQGEEVMCAAPFPEVPEPYALADRGAQLPELAQPAQAVNEGRKMLLAAIDIWTQECANPRYLVPDDVRDAGVRRRPDSTGAPGRGHTPAGGAARRRPGRQPIRNGVGGWVCCAHLLHV
ncbi:MAG: hypothetical protein M5R40_04640 [Anaerolineae bacterium]|nr:hypothetical protein [Anaerolineae bacterium]